jgi:hypothetical protein
MLSWAGFWVWEARNTFGGNDRSLTTATQWLSVPGDHSIQVVAGGSISLAKGHQYTGISIARRREARKRITRGTWAPIIPPSRRRHELVKPEPSSKRKSDDASSWAGCLLGRKVAEEAAPLIRHQAVGLRSLDCPGRTRKQFPLL